MTPEPHQTSDVGKSGALVGSDTHRQSKRAYGTPEGRLKRDIMEYLNALPGCYARVLQLGGIRGRSNSSAGMSDILACYRGHYLAIEVKTEKGVLSPEQKLFLCSVKANGGRAIVARCLQDVISEAEDLRMMREPHGQQTKILEDEK